jgi:hypothetical protein
MSGKAQRPPSGEPWIWLTRELVASPAWQSLGISARRVIDFLLIEHMQHGGRENGELLAPRRQLVEFGIRTNGVSAAIEEVERAGLVDCRRGVGRRPSVYSLTWLPLKDGTEPSNRWRSSAVASAKRHSLQMSAKTVQNECQTALTKAVASAKRHSQRPVSSSAKRHSSSRISYHGKAEEPGALPNGVAAGDPQPAVRGQRRRQQGEGAGIIKLPGRIVARQR